MQTLADGLATLDEVIAKYGPPDDDMPNGHGELFPERAQRYRTLRYSKLSDKYIGPKKTD